MPGQGRKHLQLAGYWICRCLAWGWKHLQLAGIGFADAWPGLEASATCWNWICRYIIGVNSGRGSIHNLLELDLQMPGQRLEASAICWNWICRCLVGVRKHLQFVGIGFADAWSGLEASVICWNWICRCLVGVGSICNLLELDLQMPGWGWKHLQFAGIGFADAWSGLEASATCWNWICRCLVRIGSICNLLELDLQMPGRGWKHLQLAGIGFADAWSGSEASAIC